MAKELSYFQRFLSGPILKIEDPADFSREDIIKSYIREIAVMARKYVRVGIEHEDLVEEGVMGLLDAIKRFDKERGNGNPKAFHNLAIVRIKNYMFNFFLANSQHYKLPPYMARAINLVGQAGMILERHGYEGDLEQALLDMEIHDSLPPDVSKELMEMQERITKTADSLKDTYAGVVCTAFRIQREIEEYERTEEGYQPTPEELVSDREYFEEITGTLYEIPREIIRLRILEGLTLEDIGKRLHLTRERVRQILNETMDYLAKTRMYKESVEA